MQLISFLCVKDALDVLCKPTSDAKPMSINTTYLVQTDQCTRVLHFQDSFIFYSKYVRLNYNDFYYVLFAKKL